MNKKMLDVIKYMYKYYPDNAYFAEGEIKGYKYLKFEKYFSNALKKELTDKFKISFGISQCQYAPEIKYQVILFKIGKLKQ